MNRVNSEEIDIGISGLRKLTETIKQLHDFDMSIFAGTSLKRRIAKVIHMNNFKDLDALIARLSSQPAFFPVFLRQMTVPGTEFFRDPALWRYFRDEICKVLQTNYMRVRIWIPGCSTGEEVVSMAITLKEAGLYDKAHILATDFNNEIIENSRKAHYPNNILEMSENNYKRFKEDEAANFAHYIQKQTNGFNFSDDLYQNISYAVFDDKELQKIRGINVIWCRNYFIYFTAQYQDKLLSYFTEKLTHNGYLAIGNKENISFCKDENKYNLIYEHEKVFKKIAH